MRNGVAPSFGGTDLGRSWGLQDSPVAPLPVLTPPFKALHSGTSVPSPHGGGRPRAVGVGPSHQPLHPSWASQLRL